MQNQEDEQQQNRLFYPLKQPQSSGQSQPPAQSQSQKHHISPEPFDQKSEPIMGDVPPKHRHHQQEVQEELPAQEEEPHHRHQRDVVEEEEEPQHSYPERPPMHQREVASTPQLPRDRFRHTLIIGAITGVLVTLQWIIITYLNTPLYQTASIAHGDPSKLGWGTAFAIFGLFCLTTLIGFLFCFIAGFITGKVAVHRRLGFLAGFIAGIVTYGIGLLVRYLPNYPDTQSSPGSTGFVNVSGGIVVIVILFLIFGAVGGLLSWVGSRLATRHHPYYAGYSG